MKIAGLGYSVELMGSWDGIILHWATWIGYLAWILGYRFYKTDSFDILS